MQKRSRKKKNAETKVGIGLKEERTRKENKA